MSFTRFNPMPPDPSPKPPGTQGAPRSSTEANTPGEDTGMQAGGPVPIGPDERPPQGTPSQLQGPSAEPAAGEHVSPSQAKGSPAKPAWRVLEPTDRTDPVPHEVPLVSQHNNWRIVAGSVRGRLHAHDGKWRDDTFAVDSVTPWTFAAVADGAGSAKASRVGARIAVDTAIFTLKELLTGFRMSEEGCDIPMASDCLRLRAFLAQGLYAARAAVLKEAQARQCPSEDLYTTLLLAVHCPWQAGDVIATINVGDGAIAAYSRDGHCDILSVTERGAYAGEVLHFLTSLDIEHDLVSRAVVERYPQPVLAIALMSDGVSEDFFPEDQCMKELFVGDPIKELKAADGSPLRGLLHEVARAPGDGQPLLAWLRYELAGSSDDRTVVLLCKEDAADAHSHA